MVWTKYKALKQPPIDVIEYLMFFVIGFLFMGWSWSCRYVVSNNSFCPNGGFLCVCAVLWFSKWSIVQNKLLSVLGGTSNAKSILLYMFCELFHYMAVSSIITPKEHKKHFQSSTKTFTMFHIYCLGILTHIHKHTHT